MDLGRWMKGKAESADQDDLLRWGRDYCEGCMALAESKWKRGKKAFALNLLRTVVRKHPEYAQSYRLMAKILIEEGEVGKEIVWCFERLRKLGALGPEDERIFSLKKQVQTPAGSSVGDPNNHGIKTLNVSQSKKKIRSALKRETPSPPPKPVEPEIRMTALIDPPIHLHQCFKTGRVSSISRYFLAQKAAHFSRADQFENLICLNTLKNAVQYRYQMDTARKVMRSFKGRVLLADEVGLGKTIEAGMVLKEYLMRGMVRKALILTPPALMSRWREELAVKFQIKAVATDSAELHGDPEHFWKNNDLIVASLAMARNKRHRPLLRGIEFDMVIVDEAHHVKNDGTLGWKLVDALKSRFLLLLTANPVENNLMDLFNLINLIKPGQLGTKTAFKRQFVLGGDSTQPGNREKLRRLIGEVMIRNTRVPADIKLPPRHVVTVLGQTQSKMGFEDRIPDIYGQSRNDQNIAEAFSALGDELLSAGKQYDKI